MEEEESREEQPRHRLRDEARETAEVKPIFEGFARQSGEGDVTSRGVAEGHCPGEPGRDKSEEEEARDRIVVVADQRAND